MSTLFPSPFRNDLVVSVKTAVVQPYALPSGPPVGGERDGAWLRLTDKDARVGIGELAAWPGFSPPLQLLLRGAHECAAWMTGAEVRNPRDWAVEATQRWASPVVFAWETAILDLAGQALGLPLAQLLSQSAAERVAVNALVASAEQAQSAVGQGFRTLKFKLNKIEDIDIVRAVRAAVSSEVKLRVDLGGKLVFSEARALLLALRPLGVEYVEDPIASQDAADWSELAAAGTPLAVDQHAGSAAFVDELLNRGAISAVVIKPMYDGGIHLALERAHRWRSRGATPVVTGALESGVGIYAALHLACALRTPLACGLTTPTRGVECPGIVNGFMALPAIPGLGVAL